MADDVTVLRCSECGNHGRIVKRKKDGGALLDACAWCDPAAFVAHPELISEQLSTDDLSRLYLHFRTAVEAAPPAPPADAQTRGEADLREAAHLNALFGRERYSGERGEKRGYAVKLAPKERPTASPRVPPVFGLAFTLKRPHGAFTFLPHLGSRDPLKYLSALPWNLNRFDARMRLAALVYIARRDHTIIVEARGKKDRTFPPGELPVPAICELFHVGSRKLRATARRIDRGSRR